MNMLPELLKTADAEVYAAMEKEKGRISHAFPGFCRML